MEQLRLWRKDPTVFWRNYRPATSSCPIAPGAAAAYFKQMINSFAPASPLAPPTGSPGRHLDATSAYPTTEEIVEAIDRMHSTADEIDGLPTCLLRPRLPPAAAGLGEQAQGQPAQPDGNAPAAACPTNAIAYIADGLRAVFERVTAGARLSWCRSTSTRPERAGGRHHMWNPWSQPSHSSIEAALCCPARTWQATSS
jgi:hypothetical protein